MTQRWRVITFMLGFCSVTGNTRAFHGHLADLTAWCAHAAERRFPVA